MSPASRKYFSCACRKPRTGQDLHRTAAHSIPLQPHSQAGGPRPFCGRSTGAAAGEPAASGAAGGPRDGLSPHVVPNTLGKREQGNLVASDSGRYSSLGQLPRARGPPSELWVWGIPGRAGGPSPRLHHFWACPVAQAVVDQLSVTIVRPISRAEVWLAQTPEGVEQCVWDVVVLAAITAMEQGRRFMAATLAGDPQEAPGPSLLERAITRVGLIFGAGFGDLRPSVFRERGGARWARDTLS
jgi:hypothetical protein